MARLVTNKIKKCIRLKNDVGLFQRVTLTDTMALLRLERTMNLLCHYREGGREGGGTGGVGRGREGMG